MLLKKYSDFGGGKKKSDSEFLSYVKFWKKIKYPNFRVVRKTISERKKNHSSPPPPPPSLQVKWSVL